MDVIASQQTLDSIVAVSDRVNTTAAASMGDMQIQTEHMDTGPPSASIEHFDGITVVEAGHNDAEVQCPIGSAV